MQEGNYLKDKISRLDPEQLADWDAEHKSWEARVSEFLMNAGKPSGFRFYKRVV